MTVADLIAELQRFPPHAPVYVKRAIEVDGRPVGIVTEPADAARPGGSPYGVVIEGA